MNKTQYAIHHVASLLLRGGLKPGDRLPALRCVARELNISIFAVKKAMDQLAEKGVILVKRGSGCVMESASKGKLEAIVREVELAGAEKSRRRRLSSGTSRKSSNVVLSISERSPGFFGSFLPGFTSELSRGGHNCVLSLNGGSSSLEADEMARLLDADSTSGFLIEPVVRISSPLYLADMKRKRIPAVFFGDVDFSDSSEYDSVGCDGAAGMTALLEHLFSLGHRAIAYYGLPSPLNEANKTRYAAYASAMASAGLPGLPQLDLRGGGSVEENARRLEDFIAAAPAPPSAFVCFNDSQALNLIKTLKVLDLEVPRDVSVCGFDDRETASSSIPSLTTMRYPFEELARTASKMLLEKIDALRPFDFYERLLLKPTLVVRESSAAIR